MAITWSTTQTNKIQKGKKRDILPIVFDHTDLTDGVLEVIHGRGTTLINPIGYYTPDGVFHSLYDLFYIDETNKPFEKCYVNFGGSLVTGNHLLLLEFIKL
jgi:hypothetical protein